MMMAAKCPERSRSAEPFANEAWSGWRLAIRGQPEMFRSASSFTLMGV
jgi:hypothetical protein